MLYLVLGMLAGLAGHQTDHMLRRWERGGTSRGWLNLARSGIGIVLALPVHLLFHHGDERPSQEVLRDAGLFILTFASVGVGTAIGYLLDDVQEE